MKPTFNGEKKEYNSRKLFYYFDFFALFIKLNAKIVLSRAPATSSLFHRNFLKHKNAKPSLHWSTIKISDGERKKLTP